LISGTRRLRAIGADYSAGRIVNTMEYNVMTVTNRHPQKIRNSLAGEAGKRRYCCNHFGYSALGLGLSGGFNPAKIEQ